jgi:hypothetical protein
VNNNKGASRPRSQEVLRQCNMVIVT